MSKETAELIVAGLLQKYQDVAEGKRPKKLKDYTEEETKKDFIEPLFEALGWNVRDSNEVSAEETISKRRVDYGFRINGIPKFFLEAKPLKADLYDPKIIGQAIDYSWSVGCTWAVLTDFESVMIFNAEWKTEENLMQNLFREIPCQEFLNRFDELWLLSKESLVEGLLDKEAEKLAKKAKMAPIDQHLLNDFSRWRNALSKNISIYNKDKNLTEEQLDEAVQKLLNRLVFIRKAEDAELEEPVLKAALRASDAKALYIRLGAIFRKFEKIYASELFEESLIDQDLVITNDVLKEVITGLYYPAGKLRRYDFSIIPADVLGNVYEQYLGHILKKTKKRVDIKESHARRKEEGIYYTPTYIVDYIVKNTLGELLKDKKVDVEKIRVLDPACGSGSFLIKAFDVLNEHYSKHDKDYSQTQLDTTGQGTTFTKKVEILQKNIFGVDLDKQAVEIARLNLLLKIAEKRERLPLLKQNIKNGNSLIDDEEVARNKAFKWKEQFKQIMDEGGFDIVIGNPPYISATSIGEKDKLFYKRTYESARGRLDTYGLFVEKSLNLCKTGGYVGFIIPNKFITNVYFKELRNYILKTCNVMLITYLEDTVFEAAAVNNIIIVLKKIKNPDANKFVEIQKLTPTSKENITRIKQWEYSNSENKTFSLEPVKSDKISEKINTNSVKMGDICDVRDGIIAGKCKDILFLDKKINDFCKKIIFGDDMGRYQLSWQGRYVDYRPEYMKKQETIRVKGRGLGIRLRVPEIFEVEKIITRKTADKIIATYDPLGFYFEQTVHGSILSDSNFNLRYLLAILNSKLYEHYYKKVVHQSGTIFPQVRIDFLKKLPIKNVPESQQQPLIKLVDKILSLNKQLSEIGDKKTDERARIEEEIKRIDTEIDELVYKLYGITEEEKKIIKESLKQ